MSNKSAGTAFEKEFAELLANMGFWAHCLRDNQNGQPFDVIAVRNGIAFAFDCKETSERLFKLRRIEENQWMAMKRWEDTGNHESSFFVIRFSHGRIWLLPFQKANELLMRGKQSVSELNMLADGITFTHWRKNLENYNQ